VDNNLKLDNNLEPSSLSVPCARRHLPRVLLQDWRSPAALSQKYEADSEGE